MKPKKFATLEPGSTEWKWNEADIDLAFLQDWVEGYIQLVPVDADGTLYCNDEGKLDNLPICAAWLHPKTHEVLDYLHGRLILLGGGDADGEETDLTPEVLTEFRKHIKPVIMAGDMAIVMM